MSARIKARIRKNQIALWQQYIELAILAYESGQFGVGNKMLQAASRECACDEEMCTTLAKTFECLAELRAQAQDKAHCERLMKKAIAIYVRLGNDVGNGNISRILFRLAELAAENNRHEVALRYFGKAIIVGKRVKNLSVQVRNDQAFSLGRIWTQKGRHDEALIVFNYIRRVSELCSDNSHS